MRDLANHVHPLRCISPAAATTDNTAWVGQVIDRQGYNSLTYLIQTGGEVDADATFTALLEESNDNAIFTTVADLDTVGTQVLASFRFDDDNETRKLGYIGNCRYTRLTITPANNASAAFCTAVALLGHPDVQPTPNPPV